MQPLKTSNANPSKKWTMYFPILPNVYLQVQPIEHLVSAKKLDKISNMSLVNYGNAKVILVS